jgi:RNA polymerase sigma factor (sigma-70 family)
MRRRVDQERFQALLKDHQRIVYKVANTYCRVEEDQRDLIQEISYQLWRAFPTYDESRSFSTWMYRIALNVAISFVRREGYRARNTVSLDDRETEPQTPTKELDDRVDVLRQFIDQLDDLNRALLLLYMEEHSYQEIAEILGISETNVGTKVSRLKQRIRQEAGNP